MTDSDVRARALALIRDYYTAFNRGDHAGMVALMIDDVAHDLNEGEREIGTEAFLRFMQRMATCYNEHLGEITVLANNDGHRAAAEYVVHGTYIGTDRGLPAAHGQRYAVPGGAFFTIAHDADGSAKIARITNYYNLQNWITQVDSD